ncbi:MAG: HlyD family secretion protein [Candidatus Cryptobacteroides sp.]
MKHLLILPAALAAFLAASCANETRFDACGTFEADEVLVSSQGAGQLMWFNAEEGALLSKGDYVGLVDTVQLHLQKVQLQAQMKSVLSSRPDIGKQVSWLKSRIATQKTEKERIERLVARGAAPSKQLDDIVSEIKVLEDQLDAQFSSLSKNASSIDHNAVSLDAQIAIVDDRIARCSIVSPVSGTVLSKYVSAGELVTQGTPLIRVADLESVYLRAYFTSGQIAEIKLGDTVTVTADFGGDRQYQYEGRISWISQESEFTPKAIQTRDTRESLVYAVKIAVKNDGRIKLGMYGTVNL